MRRLLRSLVTDTYFLNTRNSILLLLQSALQPLWVLACSTIVKYSQQEGFYRVPLPAARQTPQPGGPVIRTFQLSPQGVPSVWRRKRTPIAEGGTMGEKWPRILPKGATSTSLLVSFTCRKFTTWDRRLYFPSRNSIAWYNYWYALAIIVTRTRLKQGQ